MIGPLPQTFFELFPPEPYLRAYEYIPGDQMPQPYRKLLVHEHHMTVTVEEHHGSLVDVKVLDVNQKGDAYARKILLTLQSTGKIVMFGLVRIHLQFCSDEVRAKIIERKTPLGRILIEHDVLRRIEPTAYLRLLPGPEMMEWFEQQTPVPTYGRLAYIHCDGKPAIELLEVVRPE
jgi:chorismate-pyruvate lyase